MLSRISLYTSCLILLIFIVGQTDLCAFPWSYNMWVQPSIQPYELPVQFPQLSVTINGLRIKPYPREEFENITVNPHSPTVTSVNKGEQLYNIYCIACHGPGGKGDGPIVKRGYFYPLDLTSQGVQGRADGYIYAYIRYGGKVMMPSYRESINPEGAWNIVNYVRKLQGKLGNTEEISQ